jgi:hypothetical protein
VLLTSRQVTEVTGDKHGRASCKRGRIDGSMGTEERQQIFNGYNHAMVCLAAASRNTEIAR